MKKAPVYLLAAVLAAVLPMILSSAALAQATVSGDVSVIVEERAITLEQLAGLDFGTVLAFGRNGFVTVSTSGTTSASGAFSSLPGAPAQFRVTGVPNAPYTVTLPANDSVTVTNGSESMTIDNFNRTAGSSQLLLDGAGEDNFAVGARLNTNSRQPGGTYTGTYSISVDYN